MAVGLEVEERVAGRSGDHVVVPEPSRYSGPLTLARARAEMDLVEHRLLFFIDAGDPRGMVLYHAGVTRAEEPLAEKFDAVPAENHPAVR
jgi:hypothetical protein